MALWGLIQGQGLVKNLGKYAAAIALIAAGLAGDAMHAYPAAAAARPGCGAAGTAAWHASPVLYTARLGTDLPMIPRDDDANVRPLNGRTVRMIVRPEATGTALRLHFNNRYGERPLRLGAVTVAEQDKGASVNRDTVRDVLFGGRTSASIPAGGQLFSDTITMTAVTDVPLAVSVYLLDAAEPVTRHVDTGVTSYVSGVADYSDAFAAWPFSTETPSTFYLDGIDVWTPTRMNAVVAVGDSITDSIGLLDSRGRWTDALQRRLNAAAPGRQMVVLNAAIAGNRILTDAPYRLGESALSRFRWDIAWPAGVTDVILHEGTNDIGLKQPTRTSRQIIAGMQRFAAQAHANGLRVFVTTITPTTYRPYSTGRALQMRDAVNSWIRADGPTVFDGVFDFATAVASPSRPNVLARFANIGDRLHLSLAGEQKLADEVDVTALTGSPCLAPSSD